MVTTLKTAFENRARARIIRPIEATGVTSIELI